MFSHSEEGLKRNGKDKHRTASPQLTQSLLQNAENISINYLGRVNVIADKQTLVFATSLLASRLFLSHYTNIFLFSLEMNKKQPHNEP